MDEKESFNETSAKNFSVRGPNYLNDRKKEPSRPAVFRPIGVQTYMRGDGDEPIFHAGAEVPTLVAHMQANPYSFFFLVAWAIPGPPHRTAIFAFERRLPVGVDEVFDRLFDEMVNGTDEQRKSRFKYIPAIKVAPWMVLSGIRALGGEKPTMLCKKLEMRHFNGPNYCEIDINVGSNPIANAVTGLVLPKLAGMTIEHAFLLEGHTEDELPERVLGTIRIQQTPLIEATVRF